VHNLSPGMVLTDLLLKDSTPVARRFFNTLAEEPETVAKDLVPRILGTRGTGQSIECLSPASAFFKVAFGFPQIISGGRFFDKDGNRVKVSGSHYQENGVKSI
jgi:chlorophyll(ide) b reductase